MPGACLNSWQTNCEWSVGYVWHSLDWVERGIYICLGLMLVYTLFVVLQFFLPRFLAFPGRPSSNLIVNRSSELAAAYLRRRLGAIKSIGALAPFLGLFGTCYGLLAHLFIGFGLQKSAAERILMTNAAATLIPAAAGIFVAIPAMFSHNFIRTRIEALECDQGVCSNISGELTAQLRSIQFAQTLPLQKRFVKLPSFSLLAASALGCVVVIFMAFEPYVTPSGLPVALPSANCDDFLGRRPVWDRLVVLRITNSGQAFINMEPEDWPNLPHLLGEIYRSRQEKVLYVLAEDDVPFQTVADAIDIARNSPGAGLSSLDIKILLVTPMTSRDCAVVPIRIIPTKKSSKG